MSLEMIGLRLMTFHFGGGVNSSAILITIVLSAISIGAMFASRYKTSIEVLSKYAIYLRSASLYILITHLLLKSHLLELTHSLSVGPVLRELFLSSVLYFVPCFIWGQALPLIISLNSKLESINKSASTIIVVSTIGSILGTLITPYFLLPKLGEAYSILLICVSSIFVIFLCLRNKLDMIILCLIVLTGGSYINGVVKKQKKTVYDTPLNRIEIEENNTSILFRTSYRTDTFIDTSNIMNNFWTLSYLAPALTINPKEILILGVAGGVNLLQARKIFPESKITAVEIDEEIVKISDNYLGGKVSESADIFYEDARLFLKKTSKKYDYIIIDIYKNGFIPEHCISKEFFELVYNRLSSNGIVNINSNLSEFYFDSRASGKLRSIRHLKSTLRAAGFEKQYFNKLVTQLIGFKNKKDKNNLNKIIENSNNQAYPHEFRVIANASYYLSYLVPKEHFEYDVIYDDTGISYDFSHFENVYQIISGFEKTSNNSVVKISEAIIEKKNNKKGIDYNKFWVNQSQLVKRKNELKYFIEDTSKTYPLQRGETDKHKVLLAYNNLMYQFRNGDLNGLQKTVSVLNKYIGVFSGESN
jgi:spermidine synthase